MIACLRRVWAARHVCCNVCCNFIRHSAAPHCPHNPQRRGGSGLLRCASSSHPELSHCRSTHHLNLGVVLHLVLDLCLQPCYLSCAHGQALQPQPAGPGTASAVLSAKRAKLRSVCQYNKGPDCIVLGVMPEEQLVFMQTPSSLSLRLLAPATKLSLCCISASRAAASAKAGACIGHSAMP